MALFTLQQARHLLPHVRELTEDAMQEARSVLRGIQEFPPDATERQHAAETLRGIVEGWAEAIEALGAEARGLWLVDFDDGEQYLCWKYPEVDLKYCHGYEEGYRRRRPIDRPTFH